MAEKDAKTASVNTMSLSDAWQRYLANCRAKGLRPKTIQENYQFAVERVFFPWAAKNGIERIDQLDSFTLDRFSGDLQANGGIRGPLTRTSSGSYVRVVNRFTKWAAGSHAQGAAPPDLGNKLRSEDLLTRAEIQRMEDAAQTERDKLIVRILGDTGIRVGELLSIEGRSATRRGGADFLRVYGKPNRRNPSGEREISITRELSVRVHKFAKDEAAPLFNARFRGTKSKQYEPLGKTGVEQMVRWLAREAGVSKRVYPHLFRHSFATFMWKKTGDPIKVMRWLGHTSLTMLERRYGHLIPEDTHQDMLDALKKGD